MRKILLPVFIFLLVLMPVWCPARVQRYGVRVVEEYPHSTSAYTQGLFFWGSDLCESVGEYGRSAFRRLELSGGNELFRIDFHRKYFVEGSVVMNGKLYILTWRENEAFVYDAESMKLLESCHYPREGWGLTTDGRELIASDGSDLLYFLDEDLRLKRSVSVTMGGNPVRFLNELEWIDGRVWANVYTTDKIVVINPSDGVVEALIDCEGLLPDFRRTRQTDVLNGIARDPSDGSIYLTGKNWPALFRVELVR